MPRVYLDSCIVIYLIQGPESLSRTVRDGLVLGELCTSDLTRLECRVWPMREGDEELLAQFDEFFSSQDIERLRSRPIRSISPPSSGPATAPRPRTQSIWRPPSWAAATSSGRTTTD